MLDVVAAGASATVEPLTVFHADAEDAYRVSCRYLVLIDLSELAVVVPDDAATVVSDLQISVFLIDERPHLAAKPLFLRQEPDLADHASALCVLHCHHTALLVDGQ